MSVAREEQHIQKIKWESIKKHKRAKRWKRFIDFIKEI